VVAVRMVVPPPIIDKKIEECIHCETEEVILTERTVRREIRKKKGK
jgi:hypothetical protein